MLITQTWYQPMSTGIIIYIYAQPSAKKTQIAGLHDGRLKIQIAAPAADEKANQELLKFLKQTLSIPLSCLTMTAGEKNRRKTILCRGITEEQCLTYLKFNT